MLSKGELKLCAFDVTWAILLSHAILVVCCSLSLTRPIYLTRISHQETILKSRVREGELPTTALEKAPVALAASHGNLLRGDPAAL